VLQGGDARQYAPADALMIRPELIELELGATTTRSGPVRARGTVREVQFFGSFWRVQVQPEQGGALLVDLPVHGSAQTPETGASAQLYWADAAMHVIEPAARA
jgi:putative spermidine/putrescine transport system ATP-binding protein